VGRGKKLAKRTKGRESLLKEKKGEKKKLTRRRGVRTKKKLGSGDVHPRGNGGSWFLVEGEKRGGKVIRRSVHKKEERVRVEGTGLA